MSLSPGTRLGSYEVIALLGSGGMGEVYRARDPRLAREVAIKVLSTELAADPQALARFEREALSVARLSHPNILSIFEFSHEANTAFVVTELVEGETLRTRLHEGPLPKRRAIAYAVQIARGIAAAHSRGVVHRDLKPENVMITRDDQVKILDFGLAKSTEPGADDMTRAGDLATSAGTVMGTFGYMAPEQVRGLAVDHRADIFAFGAVLYEMLSGARAFMGETAADTMSAILTKDPPDLDRGEWSVDPGLARIVRRCVEKQPELRFQSANDLAFALETLSVASTASAPVAEVVTRRRPRLTTLIPWASVAVAVAVAGGALMYGRAGPTEARWSNVTRITDAAGEETSPTLSPDGGTVAYAVRINNSWDIYAQRVGGHNAAPIVNDPRIDEGGPAYSPDGSLIAFHESDDLGGIFVAGATGESVRRLTDIGFAPAWSPDGKQIAFSTEEVTDPSNRQGVSTLYVIPASGGAMRKVVDHDAVQPFWSPSGERIVYWNNTGGQRDIYTVVAAGGTPVAVTQDSAIDWSPVWSPDGRFIYFSSDRGGAMNLWRIAVEQSTGRVQGAPEPVTVAVQASAGLPRFSKDGSRLVFTSRIESVNPVAIPFDPVTLHAGLPQLLDARNYIRVPSDVTGDGKQIAYSSIGERQEDLFIGLPDGTMRRITDDPPRDRAPMFTPDGRSVVFYSTRDGNWAAWAINVDGSGLRKVVETPRGLVYPLISPKGDTVVFSPTERSPEMFSIPFAAASGVAPIRLPDAVAGGNPLVATSWSPDGTRLAGYLVEASGRASGVGVYDLAAHMTTKVSEDDTDAAKWLADSRRLMYFTKHGSELVVFDTVSRSRTTVDVHLPAPSTHDVFAISPDNRTIYYGAARAESDIWIIERN